MRSLQNGQGRPKRLNSYQRPDESKLADKSDLWLEVLAKTLLYLGLSDVDQLTHISGGSLSEIDHDIGVDVRYLGVAIPESLQSDLIDQPASTDALDFLEDRAGARMILEPGMLASAPAQVFLHDAVHGCLIAGLQFERDGKRNISLFVERARVVAEVHVVAIDGLSLAVVREQLG